MALSDGSVKVTLLFAKSVEGFYCLYITLLFRQNQEFSLHSIFSFAIDPVTHVQVLKEHEQEIWYYI